ENVQVVLLKQPFPVPSGSRRGRNRSPTPHALVLQRRGHAPRFRIRYPEQILLSLPSGPAQRTPSGAGRCPRVECPGMLRQKNPYFTIVSDMHIIISQRNGGSNERCHSTGTNR